MLGAALDIVDAGDAVGVSRDQKGDVIRVLQRDHVDGQTCVEALFIHSVVQQVDFPVAFLADLDEVGGGLNSVIEPLFPLQRPALAFVPLAGFGETEVPRFLDAAFVRHVRQPAGDFLDVAVTQPRVELEPRAQALFGLGIVQVPFIHLAHDVPVDPRMLGGWPGRSFRECPAPVVDALLKNVPVERAVVVHAEVQVLQDAVEIRAIDKSDEAEHF